MNKIKRRKIIINQDFQWKYTATVLFTVLISVVVTALSVSWFHLFLTEDRIVCDANGRLMTILIALVVSIVLFVIVRTLFFTHTIAGPVHKVALILNRASRYQFDSEPLRFRKGDSFEDLEVAVNACVNSFKRIKTVQGDLHDRIDSLRSKMNEANLDNKNVINELNEIYDIVNGASHSD